MSKNAGSTNTSRRSFLAAATLAPLAGACTMTPSQPAGNSDCKQAHSLTPQSHWDPYPEPKNLTVRHVPVDGATLWCTDTGGDGVPVVLLHPHTGSALNWGYQQAFFADRGFRVIAYSRRGYYGSKVTAGDDLNTPASASADLYSVTSALGLNKFHLVGTAAGGMVVSDYALSHPDQLLSITIACSLVGISDDSYINDTKRLLPPQFRKLPAQYKELCASYIIANPDGVERWKALEKLSKPNPDAFDFKLFRKTANAVTAASLGNIKIPALILTGDSDPYFPQFRARKVAAMFPDSRYVLIPESSHSPYWEQYELFNKTLLDFFAANAT